MKGDSCMKSATIQLETLACPSCMLKIEGALKGLDGVDKDTIKVSFNSSKVKVDFDENKISIDEIEDAINKLGYDVIKSRVK
jgi:copper chaperone